MGKKYRSLRSQRREILRKTETDFKNKPEKILYSFKYIFTKEDRSKALWKLTSNQRAIVFGFQLPKTFSELRKGGVTYYHDDYLKEIEWYCNEILIYYNQINSFLIYEVEFEKYFLLGDYESATAILDKIENEICISHWLIEKRLLVAEYEASFQKGKEVLANIVSEENEILTNILAQYSSTRFEKDISPRKSYNIISAFTDKHSTKIQNYLVFKLKFFDKLNHQNKGAILNIDNASSIIDKYRSFLTTVKLSVSESTIPNDLLEILRKELPALSAKIRDTELDKIISILGINQINISDSTKSFVNILDLYVEEKYEDVIEACKIFMPNNPAILELYEIFVRASINIAMEVQNPFPEKSIANAILENYSHIVKKDGETNASFQNATKHFYSVQNSAWCYTLFSFINFERSIYDNSFKYSRCGLIHGQYVNPLLSVYHTDLESSLYFLEFLKEALPESLVIDFWQKFNYAYRQGDFSQIFLWESKSFRHNLYFIRALQFVGLHEEAIEKVDALLNNESFSRHLLIQHNYEDVLYLKFVSTLILGDYEESINLATGIVIKNPNVHNKFHYESLFRIILDSSDDALYRNISCVILLNQYQQSNSSIWIAFDNFLCSYGLDYPHELGSCREMFDRNKLIYFLRNIAKQDVYYSSHNYESQDDLDNERIEVCLLLAEIDQDNIEEYYSEISEITRAQLIRKGIKQIDESRIYVDVKGIKKSLDKDLRENFIRSQNLLNVPLDQLDKIIENSGRVVIPYYSKSYDNKNEITDLNIKLTSFSRFEIFVDSFYKIRDKFIASNEFGIDTYLSMRIRHGTLLGEIRSVFENFNLITKKDSATGNYLPNSYWLSKFSFNSTNIESEFNNIFSELSLQIDDSSDEFKNKILQIKTESKASDGLFDYSFSSDDLFKLFRMKMADINNYDDFYDAMIDVLWEKTEMNLANVRYYISTVLKPKVDRFLSTSKLEIEKLISRLQYPTINELIREITSCQTSISVEFDKISQWFQRTNNKNINDFTIELPINASLSAIRRLYPTYSTLSPSLSVNANTIFDGEFFANFTDIFQILLHNIIKHSHLNPTDLCSSINVFEIDKGLQIVTKSNFDRDRDLREMNEIIVATSKQLATIETIEKTRKEGGTGFLKIKKILQTDLLRTKYTIQLFPVDENRVFHSEIIFEIENLQKN